MLAIQPSSTSRNLTPNTLPCKIHHNGPVPTSKRYWSPKTNTKNTTETISNNPQDNIQTSYFRGRKLQGQPLPVPEGYTGKILQKTNETLPQAPNQRHSEDDGVQEDIEEAVEVKTLKEIGHFDEIVVWGHEELPDKEADEYMKGVREWVGFAEAMHTWDDPKTSP